MDKPTKPTDLMPRSFGGTKTNFSSTLQTTGFEPSVPQIYGGANLNYQLNATGQELDYCETICDFINALPVGKTITTDSNNKLVYEDLRVDLSGYANVSLSNLDTTGNQKIVPVGTIIWQPSTTAPSGYLICNGSAISRTDYANLFSKISTTFGEGDGSTTFNIPNLIGKIIKGDSSNMGTTNTTITSTSVNLNHKHSYQANWQYATGNYTDSQLGNHSHGTTLPTIVLLPCIKY